MCKKNKDLQNTIWIPTRLSSIESQPEKVFVVGVVVDVVVVFVVIIVGHKNLTLKFGQNSVNNKWHIAMLFSLF